MSSTETASSQASPPIVRAMQVNCSPSEAFSIFTDEIGAWWPLRSHGIFGNRSGGLSFLDGHLVEVATDGTTSIWGEIIEWDPGARLVITWHPGEAAGPGSEVEVVFEPTDAGTRVVLEHRGWEAFGDQAAARRRSYVGPGTWGSVLEHFCDLVEGPMEPADLTALEVAYDGFFAEASNGPFIAPTNGGWSAAQVLAHVALNDAAMLAVCHSIVDGQNSGFDNTTCQDPSVLQRWVDQHESLSGLIAAGEHVSRQLRAALNRLSPDQLSQLIHCTLSSDGNLMLDDERPWSSIAIDVQAARHLPSHTEQIAALRA